MISKTDYLLYRECPKNAWLKIHKPDVYYAGELSDFEKSIIETGNEVEIVARGLFPTGVLIGGRDEGAQRKTALLIESKEKTIFQPIFVKDGFMAAIDVLQFDEKSGAYNIFEIKASNQIKEKIHTFDLAFQVNLLIKAGIKVGTINLLHLNPDYVRKGELEITKLFTIDDVTETVSNLLEAVDEDTSRALKYLMAGSEPSGPCDCVYKGRSSHCTTFSYSNPHIPEYSVHDIARIGVSKAKLTELIDGNVFHLHEIPEHIELSDIQKNQVNVHISRRPIIKADKIAEELRSLVFPIYFLDYETFPCAIPRFDGFSPYQQIPFQYSLHIVESSANNEPNHFEFIHTSTDDPSPPFAESLQNNIGKIGTIIVWNKKFECGRNDELAKRIPSAQKFFADLNTRVYDLMDIFSKQYYVHHDFQGSTSIKYVLPVLAPELSYKKLNIQEGGTATQRWNEMMTGDLTNVEKETIAANLLEYCKLDTYAMYMIWRNLSQSV
jgi:hypothetical protein